MLMVSMVRRAPCASRTTSSLATWYILYGEHDDNHVFYCRSFRWDQCSTIQPSDWFPTTDAKEQWYSKTSTFRRLSSHLFSTLEFFAGFVRLVFCWSHFYWLTLFSLTQMNHGTIKLILIRLQRLQLRKICQTFHFIAIIFGLYCIN